MFCEIKNNKFRTLFFIQFYINICKSKCKIIRNNNDQNLRKIKTG